MRFLVTFYLLLFLTVPAFAQDYAGKVIGITDGDTFTLMTTDRDKLKIRLAEIDTPESGQPYGKKARQALSELIFQKDVIVIQTDTDRYGRIVGKVYQDKIYVNAAMVKEGAAWVYREYAEDQSLFVLEKIARERKTGIWSLSEAENMPPWEWRKQKRAGQIEEITPVACTMDAKQCPDGSYVSRKGPDCKFALCPVNDNSAGAEQQDDGFTRVIAPPPRSDPLPTRSYTAPVEDIMSIREQ